MSNTDSVGQLTLDSFGNGKLTNIKATQLNTAGNAVISMPILRGGLTNGGAVANSGGVIIRRITVQNPTGTVASAYVSISATNDGGNVIVANVALSTVSSTGKYQDLTIASPYTANVVSGSVTQALYVNVNVASGNANTVEIAVYGDVVSF
jgi:hypothetical protein